MVFLLTASAGDFTGLCNDFVMIKYPRKGRDLPHDRVFTMDPAYLVRHIDKLTEIYNFEFAASNVEKN